jgi:hypothetical protein
MVRRSNDSYTFVTVLDLRLHDNWGHEYQDVIDTINTTISPYSAEGAPQPRMPAITSTLEKLMAGRCSRQVAITLTAIQPLSKSICL